VSTAQGLGAEFVIAISVLPLRNGRKAARLVHERLQQVHSVEEGSEVSPAALEDRLGLVEIVWQASRILASQIASSRLRDDRPGYLLEIPVPEVGMFDYHRTSELVEVGRRSAEQALPELRSALARAVPWYRRLRDWQRRAAAILAFSSY
jgi:predicted acylesterase/phospholipase RssA